MLKRLRDRMGTRHREADPLVKVAGMPTLREAQTCLDALAAKDIKGVLKQDSHELGAFELWVRASQEPQARLVMGLSGRSVIRLERRRPGDGRPEKKR